MVERIPIPDLSAEPVERTAGRSILEASVANVDGTVILATRTRLVAIDADGTLNELLGTEQGKPIHDVFIGDSGDVAFVKRVGGKELVQLVTDGERQAGERRDASFVQDDVFTIDQTGTRIATAHTKRGRGGERSLRIYDVDRSKEPVATIPLGERELHQVEFNRQGNAVAYRTIPAESADGRDTIGLLSRNPNGTYRSVYEQSLPRPIEFVAFIPGGRSIIAREDDGDFVTYSLDGGGPKRIKTDSLGIDEIESFDFSPDGTLLAVADQERIAVLSVPALCEERALRVVADREHKDVTTVSFGVTGELLIGERGGTARVYAAA
ncbi:MAG: WD40 repeat domain-containing protein [Patescibacteria group bacterium]